MSTHSHPKKRMTLTPGSENSRWGREFTLRYVIVASLLVCALAGMSTIFIWKPVVTHALSTWTQHPVPGVANWGKVVTSVDGTKVAGFVSGGYVYTSSDSGQTWSERTGLGKRSWGAAAMSADGRVIAAVAPTNSNQFFISTDSGATWNTTESGPFYFKVYCATRTPGKIYKADSSNNDEPVSTLQTSESGAETIKQSDKRILIAGVSGVVVPTNNDTTGMIKITYNPFDVAYFHEISDEDKKEIVSAEEVYFSASEDGNWEIWAKNPKYKISKSAIFAIFCNSMVHIFLYDEDGLNVTACSVNVIAINVLLSLGAYIFGLIFIGGFITFSCINIVMMLYKIFKMTWRGKIILIVFSSRSSYWAWSTHCSGWVA